mmetsp:Transcript_37013/g.109095  ORF Transcript_37013/g.109095 Transcript_37013/m.109095 type:complete len:265 (+) Transcript_37013:530-1324(+)
MSMRSFLSVATSCTRWLLYTSSDSSVGRLSSLPEDVRVLLLLPTCCESDASHTFRVNENLEPCPSVLSTLMSEPCDIASCFTRLSPRPVPPYLRVVFLSTCLNGSNMSSSLSAGIPMPVSVTLTLASGPSRLAPTVMLPVCVNLHALPTRLCSIWIMRSASPRTCGNLAGMSHLRATPRRGNVTHISVMSCTKCSRLTLSCLIVSTPFRTLAASSMSLTKVSSRIPLPLIVRRILATEDVIAPQLPIRRLSVSPMMPFRGVLNS